MHNKATITIGTLVCLAVLAGQAMASDMTARLQSVSSELAAIAATSSSTPEAYFAAVAPLGFAEQAEYEVQLVARAPQQSSNKPVATMLPVSMLLDVALGNVSTETMEAVLDAQGSDASALYFQKGPVFLDDIRAATSGAASASTQEKTSELSLSRPLVLSSSAVLVLRRGERLTLDRAKGAFIIAAGGLIVDQATIVGSETPNTTEAKFRPFILADATTGPVELSGAHIEHLGFGSDPRSAGLSITGGSADAERRSFVQDSFLSDMGSLTLSNAKQSTIRRNVFHRSTNTALSIIDSESLIIDGNVVIEPVRGHGVKLGPNASNVLLSDNIVAKSERHGVLIEGNTHGGVIFNNLFLQNHASGVAILSGSCLSLEQNVTLANADDGIMVRDSARLSFQTNIISANGRAGLSVAGNSGSLKLNENRFDSNKIGLRASASFTLALSGNDWTGQTPRLLDGDIVSYTLPLLAAIKSGEPQLTMAGAPLPSTLDAVPQLCDVPEAI